MTSIAEASSWSGTSSDIASSAYDVQPARCSNGLCEAIHFRANVKDCFAVGAAWGDIAAERARLADAIRRRHQALQHTAGLNEEVFDALVLLAAGSWEHADLARGFARVVALKQDMDTHRQLRLLKLGFPPAEAEALVVLGKQLAGD